MGPLLFVIGQQAARTAILERRESGEVRPSSALLFCWSLCPGRTALGSMVVSRSPGLPKRLGSVWQGPGAERAVPEEPRSWNVYIY